MSGVPEAMLKGVVSEELIVAAEANMDTGSGVTAGVTLLLWSMWTIVVCRFVRSQVRTAFGGAVVGLIGGVLYLLCVFAPSLAGARQSATFQPSNALIVGVLSVLTVRGVTVLGDRRRWWPTKAELLEQFHGPSADPR